MNQTIPKNAFGILFDLIVLERGTRIELVTLAWKARVIPFYEPRIVAPGQGIEPRPADLEAAVLP